jgi:hypothetical protein
MKRLAAALALLFAPSSAFATADVAVGAVRGGSVERFAWDPNASDTVYAGVHGGGIYKSTDDGATWTQIFLPTIAAHFPREVLVSAATADLVFVDGLPVLLSYRRNLTPTPLDPEGQDLWNNPSGTTVIRSAGIDSIFDIAGT